MGHRNDDKYSTLGGPPGQTDDLERTFHGGPQDNDGWYSQFGGTEQYNDDAYDWLITQGVSPGALPDMWAEYWAGGGGGPAAAFLALVPDTANDYTMEGVLNGTGDLTVIHTASLYAADFNGVYQQFPANAEVWAGARCVLTGGAGTAVVSAHGNDAPAGSPLAEAPYLQYYPAAQNDLQYSNNMTVSPWQLTASLVRSFDQTGLTGAANTATLLDRQVSTGLQNGFQDVTVIDDTATHTCFWRIKKDLAVTRWSQLQNRAFGSSNADFFLTFNPQTGATNIHTNSGGANGVVEVVDDGDWWKLFIQSDNNGLGNTNFRVSIAPAFNDDGSSSANDGTGSVIVGNCELHLNKTIAQVRGLGPIFTTTAAVATDAFISSADSANSADTPSAWYCEVSSEDAQNLIDGFLNITGTNFRATDGTNNAERPWTASTTYKVGIAYGTADAAQMAINVNGTWSTDVAYDGTMLQGILDLFRAGTAAGKMRNWQRSDAADFAAAKTIIDGLMV